MGSRTITSVVTADTIALNAAIFGYAGHSIVTPHQAIQQIWWTDERIEVTVTREFVVSKLRPNERDQLNRPMIFGEGLTDDTYLDWILRKTKRLYLILVEIGVSDQIIGIIEDSWDDDDLPIPLEEVSRLALSYKPDEQLNKKFYNTQFKFLLRPLSKHAHIDYAPNEVIPVEFVHRLPPAAALQSWSRVHLPQKPEEVFVRRKILLGEKDELDPALELQFLADIHAAREAEHEHIAPIWASWTSKGFGFWTTPFVCEHTLRSLMEFRSTASLQKLSKSQRHTILLDWLHCLTDAVAFLHHRGVCHGAISPSNILIDANNHVTFSDIPSLKSFRRKLDPQEVYNYGAPENHTSRMVQVESPPSTTSSSRSFFGHRRAKSSDTKRSFDGSFTTAVSSHGSGSSSATSIFSNDSQKYLALSKVHSNPSASTTDPVARPAFLSRQNTQYSPTAAGLWSKSGLILPSDPEPARRAPPPPPLPLSNIPPTEQDPKLADVFALGCIYLDVVNFMFKKKTTEFVKHRSTKHKNMNARGSYVDSSFHSNTTKLASWMEILEEEAKTMDEVAFRCIPQLLRLIRMMLNPDPQLRPSAATVQERLYDALISYGGLSMPHCSGRSWEPNPPLSPTMTSPSFASDSSRKGSLSETRIAAIAFPYIVAPLTPPKSPMGLFGSPTEMYDPPRRKSVTSPPLHPPPVPAKNSYTLPWMKKPGGANFPGMNFTSVA